MFAVTSVAAPAADFNGKWTFEISSATGMVQRTWEFHVDGTKVTGKESSGGWSVDILDGKVDGDTITFVELFGQTRVYLGKLEGKFIRFTHSGGDGIPGEFIAFQD